ncbi:MAG: amidohydrolase, partial [Alphaproteobacteria bacterium]
MTEAAIDCDLHPGLPSMASLFPYMDQHWRTSLKERGVSQLESASWPPAAPSTVRADWRGPKGEAPCKLETLQAQV